MAIVTDEDILKQLNGGVTPPKPKPLGSDIPDDVLDQLNSPAPAAAPKIAPTKVAPRQAAPATPVAPSSSPLFKFTQAGDQQSVMGIASPNDRKAAEVASLRRFVGDPAISAVKGAIGLPESVVGVADIVTGGRVGKALDKAGYRPKQAREILDTYLSPEQQAANKTVQDAEGFVNTLKASIQNPSTILHAGIESAPSMIGGAGVARGAMKVLPGVAPLAAAAFGEGVISAGSTAEQVRQQTNDGLLTPMQSVTAAGSGAATGIIGLLGGKLAKRLGIADVDTLLAGGAPSEAKKGIIRRAIEGAISEGALEELPQSAQEQIANNLALGKPLGEGVAETAATGLLTGAAMGGGANVLSTGDDATQADTALPPDADPARVAKLAAIMETDTPEMVAQRLAARQNPAQEMPNQVTDAAILDQLNAETPIETPIAGDATPIATPDAPLIDQLDFASNQQPFNPNQLNFEIGLMKNPNTSKTAVLIPKSAAMTGADVNVLAKSNGFRAIRSGEDFYIYDPKQIKETELRRQAKSGKNGQALGYGTDGVPADGIPYAVDVDGKGTVNPAEILDLRDQGRLGFAGVAPDMDAAVAKIREMGRDDAEVRGVPELGEQLAQREAAKQAPPAAIPSVSREDAIAAKQQVVTELAGVDPESDRAAQLQVQLDQYNKIIGGEAEYRDFQPPQSAVDLYRETETAREKLAAIVGDKRTSEIVEEIDTRLVEGDTAAGREGRGPGGRGAAFYAEMRDELQKSLDVVDNEAATSGTLLNRQRAKKQEAAEARTMEAMRRMDNQEANELAALLEQKQVSPDQVAKIEDALESGDNDAVLDAMYEAATIAKDKLKIAPPVKPRTAPKLDRQKDDAIVAISKLGGIDLAEAQREWGDVVKDSRKPLANHVLKQTRRFGAVFKNGGRPLDKAREALVDHGYLPENADLADLFDLIDAAVRGNVAVSAENTQEDEIERQAREHEEWLIAGMTEEAKAAANDVLDIIEADDTIVLPISQADTSFDFGYNVEGYDESRDAEEGQGEAERATAEPEGEGASARQADVEQTDDAGGWQQGVAVKGAKRAPTIGGVQKQGGRRVDTASLMDGFTPDGPTLFSLAQTVTPEQSKEYADAIASGAKRQALRILHRVLGIKEVDSGIERGGAHSPSGPESGDPIYDISRSVYPEDVYSFNGLRYYGTGYDAMDREAYAIIKAAEAHPNKPITVYRALEKDGPAKILPGDWVTIVRAYAKDHGESALNGDYKIIKAQVYARDIYTSGDSWLEWGYHPQEYMPELPRGEAKSSPLANRVKAFLQRNLPPLDEHGKFETGEPVTFNYIHNTESATKIFGKPKKDSPYDRGFEPSGRYVIQVDTLPDNLPPHMDSGELTFNNPLVVEGENWKRNLSEAFGNKRGKALSKAIIAAGYDGVVTIADAKQGKYVSEILDLTTFDESKAKYSLSEGGTLTPESITRIESLIAQALPDGKVTVKVVDSITPPPGSEDAFIAHGVTTGKVAGMHQAERSITSGEVRSIITLAMDGANEQTAYHEVMHGARALGIITAKDGAILARAFPDKDGVASQEREADAFADFVAGRGKKPVLSAKLIFDKVKRFLARVKAVMKGQGWRNADDVFSDLMGGRLKRNAQGVATPSAGVQFSASNPGEYPMAGTTVDGLYVRDKVPDTNSISATFNDYTVLKGIREVPLSEFNGQYESTARTRQLAEGIEESGEINPLIVAIDSEGPYILEGAHRFDALGLMGKTSFPAMVVIDNDVSNPQFSLAKAVKDRNPAALRSALTIHPKVQSLVASVFAEGRNVTRWQRSVGTMYHTAEDLSAKGMPQFREVFRKGQEFLNDVSALAVAAESLAPDIFPKLGTGKGIFHNISKADAKAIAEPLFDGTLYGGADPTRGRVFNPIELEVRYGLNAKQIELYQQARAATDQSLDDMARSLIAKNAKTVKVSFDRDMSLADMAAEVSAAIQERVDDMQASLDQAEADFQTNSAKLEGKELQAATRAHDQFVRPQKAAIELHKGAVKNINDLLKKTESLKKHGYFPLMRFGEHTVTVRDQNGETQFFSMYESIFAARNAEHKLKREFPGMEVTRGGVNKEKHKLYAGMNIEALQLFAEHLGADETAPYQEYLKEAMNNRSAMKRLIHRKGTEGYSEDAVRTLASFIISNARHASTQYNLHDMREMIQAIPEESQWDVQAKAVRLYEYLTKPTEEASSLRGYLFFHYLGGSLASGITNMTQPLTMTTPYLMTKANPVKVAAQMTAAAKDSFTDPAKVKGPLGIALRRAESEGITAPQEIHQLTAVASNKLFASSGVANATMKAWGGFFAAAEAFNRRTTFIAAFRLAKDAGKADGAAYDEASEAVTATQGIYNKGNRPEWGRGIVGAPLFTFKQYGVMYLELYNRLPVRQKAIMLGLLALMAGLEGLPFAEDAEDVIDTIGQWLGYSTNTKRYIDEQAEKALGKKGADFALRGMSSVLPIDVHGRLGMQNLIPGTSYLKQSEIDRGRDVKEFFGPLGGLFDSMTTALGLLVQGLPGRAALAASPRAVQGYAQGIEMAATGAGHDRQGRKTVEVDKKDALAKFIGFNPSKVASESRVKGSNMQDLNLLRVRNQEIVNQWAYGIANNDQGEVEAAKQKLREWNRKNPEWRMTTEKLKQSIKNKARALRSSSKDRFLKSVPKEQRRRIADEMESDG
jgi:hypothetical protein